MERILDTLVSYLWDVPLIFAILFTGLYFTICSNFFQLQYFPHIIKETFGKYLNLSRSHHFKGMISPLEAVSTAIGSSVGVGNIGGVATAISVGGPGSVFWMWIIAFIGMIIKTVEVSLSVYYRNTDEEGNTYGGPTYYIEKGIGREMNFHHWFLPAFIFGLGIFSTFFITLQNYSASEALSSTFHLDMTSVSMAYVLFTYLMIFGGIRHLGKVSSIVVPCMCLFYIFSGIIIILKHYYNIIPSIQLIFTSAFSGTAPIGGFSGAAVSQVIRMGVARSVFSSEFGWGTSPMIHSTAKTEHPVKQGLWGAFEVFVDTMIICTTTALVIIITGEWSSGQTGAVLALNAFEKGIGSFGRNIVAIGVFLFGITTSSAWYSYYEILLRHFFHGQIHQKNVILKYYKFLYPFPGLFMVLYVVNYGLPGKYIWYFADVTTAIPTFINIFSILILSNKFLELLKDYKARYLHKGTIDSEFHIFYEDDEIL
ncbi:alanine/glycine:cation symporter family protein [Inediibacterium massiliense]|uniref:alanine/glycine:cation symporter family protein n=1 Tax=Inediibacterium massiliense TaxID=1658111 RepID=UPI0006B644F6|nr:sodium:alanine symporter family protein [Inediibacterium massiliense]